MAKDKMTTEQRARLDELRREFKAFGNIHDADAMLEVFRSPERLELEYADAAGKAAGLYRGDLAAFAVNVMATT